MNQQKIDNIFALDSKERYGYLLRKVADFEKIYLIKDLDGKYVMIGSNDISVLPVWPENEFAQLFLAEDWSDFKVEENSIYDFINWLNQLNKEGVHIAGFPNLQLNTVHVSAAEMKSHLQFELSQYD
ncbi:MAG: DUF2750 domain-containing protein [Balneola sp.]